MFMKKITEDDSFNGYTNYETWYVAVQLDNDEYYYMRAQELRKNKDYLGMYNLAKNLSKSLDAATKVNVLDLLQGDE
jgi:hypothetical protein